MESDHPTMSKSLRRSAEHDSIDLAEKLWDLACKYLLGCVSRPEYELAIRTLLDEPGAPEG